MPEFIEGLKLGEFFYHEAVKLILNKGFPGLRYAAALIGNGSDVLGYDDETSRDHDWGPRLQLFLDKTDLVMHKEAIHQTLAAKLPSEIHGYPTNFGIADSDGVSQMRSKIEGPVDHRVEILNLGTYIQDYLGFDIVTELDAIDWLTFPQQKLLALTSGAVFHDDIGLEDLRMKLAWYPHDVWVYLLAACWTRIGQEEHLTGRAGQAGDEIGSALIAGRLVRDLMRLVFLMERTYAPYPKWLGSAFKKLKAGEELSPILERILHAHSWQERDPLLACAYELTAIRFNELHLVDEAPEKPTGFWGRPFQVIWGDRIAKKLLAVITDPLVRKSAGRSPIGSIDLISDNTDLLEDAELRKKVRKLFE